MAMSPLRESTAHDAPRSDHLRHDAEVLELRPRRAALAPARLTHLGALESEAVHVLREVAAEFERPVLLFSGGKDSIVLLRLAADNCAAGLHAV